ncbi:MAG: hypothetical protein LBT59_27760 [Clostridiales bacterium]|nr:hypothetical protein [Clostridiales bacterium]
MRYCSKCNSPLEANGFCPICDGAGAGGGSGSGSSSGSGTRKSSSREDIDFIGKVLEFFGLGKMKGPNRDSLRRPEMPPPEIGLDPDELLFRNYHICNLKGRMGFALAEGRMVITNRRLIFTAIDKISGGARHDNQLAIDEVSGLEVHRGRRFRAPNCFLSIILYSICYFIFMNVAQIVASDAALAPDSVLALGLIGSIGSMAGFFLVNRVGQLPATIFCALSVGFLAFGSDAAPQSSIIGVLTIVIAVLSIFQLFKASFASELAIVIKNKGGGSGGAFVISRGGSSLGGYGPHASPLYSEVIETAETALAQREIYLIIHDIKLSGDRIAYSKWVDATS